MRSRAAALPSCGGHLADERPLSFFSGARITGPTFEFDADGGQGSLPCPDLGCDHVGVTPSIHTLHVGPAYGPLLLRLARLTPPPKPASTR